MKLIDCFVSVVNMSITASVVAAVLLLLRLLFRRKMTAGFQYLLWALVLLRLLLPISIPSMFSLFNLFPEDGSLTEHAYMVSIEYVENSYISLDPDPYLWYWGISVLWITVCLLLSSYQLILLLLTKRRLSTAFRVDETQLLEECKRAVGVRQKIKLYRSESFDTPIVYGIFRPKIVLPLFFDYTDQEQLEHILLHELVHIKRFDHATKILTTLAVNLHWFNPMVWLCFRQFQRDIEISCDETVLSLLKKERHTSYARTLVELCSSQKKRYDMLMLSFSERRSLLSTRVYAVLDYKPLGRLQRIGLAWLMILLSLTTSTNPLPAYAGYLPQSAAIPDDTLLLYEEAVQQLSMGLASGDSHAFLAATHYNEPFYEELYEDLRLKVSAYKLYPQSEDLVYAYLRCENGREYVAQMSNIGGEIRAATLQPGEQFSAVMSVGESEAVRFVRNLHRFGIVSANEDLSDWAVAGLCTAEEHHDRVKRGEISAADREIPEEWVRSAAKRYFGLEDFAYYGDEELYDPIKQCYLYDPDREDPANVEIISKSEQGSSATVTASLYRDPLRLFPKATISYQLQKE